MDVVLINAALKSDANSSFLADQMQEKYEGCRRFDICGMIFDPDYGYMKDEAGFKPELVEEGLRDAFSALYSADLIIFISPNYFSFISGTAKLFLDKFYVFLNKSGMPIFENEKKLFFLLTQGSQNRGHGNGTQDWMKNFASLFRMKFFGYTVPGCKGGSADAARMKIDEIRMSLNMFAG